VHSKSTRTDEFMQIKVKLQTCTRSQITDHEHRITNHERTTDSSRGVQCTRAEGERGKSEVGSVCMPKTQKRDKAGEGERRVRSVCCCVGVGAVRSWLCLVCWLVAEGDVAAMVGAVEVRAPVSAIRASTESARDFWQRACAVSCCATTLHTHVSTLAGWMPLASIASLASRITSVCGRRRSRSRGRRAN